MRVLLFRINILRRGCFFFIKYEYIYKLLREFFKQKTNCKEVLFFLGKRKRGMRGG